MLSHVSLHLCSQSCPFELSILSQWRIMTDILFVWKKWLKQFWILEIRPKERSKHFWNLEGGEIWSTLCSKKQIHNAEKRWAGTSTHRWQLRHFGWSYLWREGTAVVGKTTPIAVVYLVDYSLISKNWFGKKCASFLFFSFIWIKQQPSKFCLL